MKKLLASIVACMVILSYMGTSVKAVSLEGAIVGLPNPFVDCKTMEEAEKLAGFGLYLPTNFIKGNNYKIRAIKGQLIEIVYRNGNKEVVLRKGNEKVDISGNYNIYEENKIMDKSNTKIKGDKNKVLIATWLDGEYSYSVSVKNLDTKEALKIIGEFKEKNEEIVIGLPNSFVDCKTMEEAEKIAGFSLKEANKMPNGYKKQVIQAIENDLIQIIYTNKDKEIVVRKGKLDDNISGNYNEYEENKTINIDGKLVHTQGKDGKIGVATWKENAYSYSVMASPVENNLELKDIKNIIKDLK